MLVWQTAQNGRLHKIGGTYYQSCMYPTNSTWPAFLPFSGAFFFLLVSIHLRHRLTVPPTKACLLCATPAGTYRVQSPGFPKIIYCCDLCIGTLSREVINRQCVSVTNISQEHPHTQLSRQNSAHVWHITCVKQLTQFALGRLWSKYHTTVLKY